MQKLLSLKLPRVRRGFVIAVCALCVAALLAGVLFSLSASAEQITMSELVAGVNELTTAAAEYLKTDSLSPSAKNTPVNKLVLTYIRQKEYNTDAWNMLCGTHQMTGAGTTYTGFATFLEQNYPENIFKTAATTDLKSVIIEQTGETTDALHMFAVLDVMNNRYENAGGWAGDVVQLAAAITNESGDLEALTSAARELLGAESGSPFGAADLIADLDAYNIFWILSVDEEFIAGTGGIAAGIEAYFNSLGSSADPAAQRTHNFADVRLYDADYTREAYRAAMYYQYYFDTYQLMGSLINVIEMVEVTEGLRNYTETLGVKIPTQGLIPPCTEHHILAAVYAFADYLYESRIAPAPDDGDITIDYTNETIKFSAANAFRVSATIEAAPDDDDGEPDEVTVTEAAVTAETDESEGGTIEYSISDGDSITEFIGKTLYARRLPYGGYLGESAAVPIAIPARPTPPENGAIEIAAMTHLSAALTLPNGIEYSIDDGKTWREASSLSELTPETTYVITARYKATADAFRSDAAAVCEFTTPKAPQVYNPPYDPYIPPAQSSATPVGDKNEPLRGEVSKEVIASFTHSTANGTATITISDSESKRIIDSAATTAVFDLSGARGVDSAVLPMDTVRSFAAAGVGVTLKTENGDLALDAAAISTAALDTAARVGGAAESDTDADGGVALTIKTTAGESGSVRLTLQLRAGDNEVTAFGGGHARVSIPFTLPDGVSPARVVPYRDDGGTLTLVRGGYNAEAGRVELRLEHFSEYIIKINDVRYAVSGGWHDDSLDYAAQRGLLDEFMQNGVIDAGQGITREAFIATYMKAAGIEPLTAFNAAQFTDVDSNSPSAAYIRTARELGIVSGVGDGKFDPSLPAVRAHFFQVMYNTLRLGLTPVPNTDTGAGSAVFSDADTLPNWVRPAVDELVRLGFLLGDEGSLSADEHFTIGTMCAAVKRLCE